MTKEKHFLKKSVTNILMHTDIWTFCADRLARGEQVVLIVIAATEGETPAKPGFKMAIAAGGISSGTVGGGKAEHDLVECAKEMLTRNDHAPRIVRQVHRTGASTDASGMICGGVQTAILYPVEQRDKNAVDAIARAFDKFRSGSVIISSTGIEWNESSSPEKKRFQLVIPSEVEGSLAFFDCTGHGSPATGHEMQGIPPLPMVGRNDNTTSNPLKHWTYEESLGPWPTAYLIGGGHVSLALSRVLATLNFHIVVFDDRPDVDTMSRNTFAHAKHVMPFDAVHAHIPEGDLSYAAIMTPSHRADEVALRSIIRKNLRYVGLMASPVKIEEVFRAMRRDGFTGEELSRVRTPIGLPIASHTPEEIAISIAAEMIQIKNCP